MNQLYITWDEKHSLRIRAGFGFNKNGLVLNLSNICIHYLWCVSVYAMTTSLSILPLNHSYFHVNVDM